MAAETNPPPAPPWKGGEFLHSHAAVPMGSAASAINQASMNA